VFLIPSGFDPSVLGINHPDPADRTASRTLFEQALQFVAAVGADTVTIGPGSVYGDESIDAATRRSVDELHARVELAGHAGITLCVEPHLGSVIHTPELTLEFVDRISGLQLALDYGHFIYQRIGQSRVDPLLAHTKMIHCRGSAPARMQVSLSENCIDFKQVVETAISLGFEGRYSLEYVWTELWRCNEVDNLSEIIRLRECLQAGAMAARDWEKAAGAGA
jgi:sugar phosphate isomerase/epimerase